jgi:hypothetical protein
MATTTTNFGWDIPQSTDLVKDGATAIAALGQDIDTALVDLKGGTTGQVLAKASGTDLDFSWVAQDDSNAIQNAIVDAKGDLISATAADTPARLAVGTNGQVLTADSTTATGLKWNTPSTGTPAFVGVSLKSTTDQTISNSTYTAITWNDEYFDTDAYHSTSVNNSRVTIPTGKAGKYLISGFITYDNNTTGSRQLLIYKNGSSAYVQSLAAANIYPTGTVSYIADLIVGDYIEMFTWQSSGSSQTLFKTGNNSSFVMQYLGA